MGVFMMFTDDELKKINADGLVSPQNDCSCKIGDLYPCGEFKNNCNPAVLKDCLTCEIFCKRYDPNDKSFCMIEKESKIMNK
jgi:hypothetical protein